MYFLALAADYDGTLAHDGVVAPGVRPALRRLRESGRRLLLVTGRELTDLRSVFPDLDLFDRVVAENGAVLLDPSTGRERLLGTPPSMRLLEDLRRRGVGPVSVGRCVVATWEPHRAQVLEAIRELGLELQIVFNKGALMILPSGLNKATGLLAALRELDVSPHNVVGIGDGENDHAFLAACGCGAAVANAVPSVRRAADVRLKCDHECGVDELAGRIVGEDAGLAPLAKHGILLGKDRAGRGVHLRPWGGNVLVVGPSGSGKSRLAAALTERMAERRLEFCVVDPEGDYVDLDHSVCIGSLRSPPAAADVLQLLHDDAVNLVVNLHAMSMADRRELATAVVERASRLRARTGRPHWLVVDEAQQVLLADARSDRMVRDGSMPSAILVSAYPHAISVEALRRTEAVVALGEEAPGTLRAFAERVGIEAPSGIGVPDSGEGLFWEPCAGGAPRLLRLVRPVQMHRRHCGKYAVGDVGADRSFYFRGADKSINVPARNLYRFLEVAEGVDDATWEHHLRAGDYSSWFRHVIKDPDLAEETARAERDGALPPHESRRLVGKAVRRRYAAPCEVTA